MPAHSHLCQQMNLVILGGKEKKHFSQLKCCFVASSAVSVPTVPPNLRDVALQQSGARTQMFTKAKFSAEELAYL